LAFWLVKRYTFSSFTQPPWLKRKYCIDGYMNLPNYKGCYFIPDEKILVVLG